MVGLFCAGARVVSWADFSGGKSRVLDSGEFWGIVVRDEGGRMNRKLDYFVCAHVGPLYDGRWCAREARGAQRLLKRWLFEWEMRVTFLFLCWEALRAAG